MLAVVSAAQSKIDGVRHIAGQRFKIEEGEFPIISVPIDLILKDDVCYQDKYKQINDFVRKVIEPAKREWMRQHPIASTLNLSRMGEKSSHSNSRLCIILSEKTRDAEVRDLQRKLSLSWDIRDRHVRDYLKNSIGFTEVEIKNNIEVFRRASELLPDLLSELALLKGKAETRTIPKDGLFAP